MWRLAGKNLFRERARFFVALGGAAFSVTLILSLAGLHASYRTRTAVFFRHVGGDVWVVAEGSSDILYSGSILDTSLQAKIAAVDGVANVRPRVVREAAFDLRGQRRSLTIGGMVQSQPNSLPVAMHEGKTDVGLDGIIVERVFAKTNKLKLGDPIEIGDRTLRIRGISEGGDFLLFQYGYVDIQTARDLFNMASQDNAYIVTLDDGVDRAEVYERIREAAPKTEIRELPAIIRNAESVLNESFLPVIRVLLVIGLIVGATVVGLTIYAAVLERRKEYGVLRAIGARGWQLARIVLVQSVLVSALGYVIGLGLAVAVGRGARELVPQFTTVVEPNDLVWVAGLTAIMALVSSLVPIARITHIDAAEVFRA